MKAKWISSPAAANGNVLYRFRKTVNVDRTKDITAHIIMKLDNDTFQNRIKSTF